MTPTVLHFDVNDDVLRTQFLEQEVPDALARLEANTPAVWGQFTAQHMVEHVAWSFEMMAGIAEFPCTTPEEKLPKYQQFLYNEYPVKRFFRSPVMGEEPPEYRCNDLAEAKSLLIQRWDDAKGHFEAHPGARTVNPVFGPLDFDQWHRFQYKHCFHHFAQFGLFEAE